MLATPMTRRADLPAAVSRRLSARLERLSAALLRRVRVWLAYRQTKAALSRLTARELQDLDLAPADIDRAAREAARRV